MLGGSSTFFRVDWPELVLSQLLLYSPTSHWVKWGAICGFKMVSHIVSVLLSFLWVMPLTLSLQDSEGIRSFTMLRKHDQERNYCNISLVHTRNSGEGHEDLKERFVLSLHVAGTKLITAIVTLWSMSANIIRRSKLARDTSNIQKKLYESNQKNSLLSKQHKRAGGKCDSTYLMLPSFQFFSLNLLHTLIRALVRQPGLHQPL